MARKIKISPHLTVDELENRYRQASDGIERTHYQIIWLLAQGRKTQEVAELTGYSRGWIYELVAGYNCLGPDALGDKRHTNPGKPPLLSTVQQEKLYLALQSPPSEGGQWDGPKVARWMSQVLGRPIHPQRGWEYLKKLENGHSLVATSLTSNPILPSTSSATSQLAKESSQKKRWRRVSSS